MAQSLIWGSFGDVVFEFLKSPVYGTYRLKKSAKYTEHSRIITRNLAGELFGQKSAKEINGLELDTISFVCKVSTLVLKALEINTGQALLLAGGAGPIAGSLIGNETDDERFYTDVISFKDMLTTALAEQTPRPFTKGTEVLGLFTLDSLDISEKDRTNGETMFSEIRMQLKEWVE